MTDANSCEIKKVLGFVRGDDFAHAGEKEAIDLVFHDIAKKEDQLLLDVGCGLGGTANYIEKQGFGKVIGIDIDQDTINYAKKTYPHIDFLLSDVASVSQVLHDKFDIIYMFNAFYAFLDHKAALEELKKLAKPHCQLIIFDYVKLGAFAKRVVVHNPITLEKFAKDLNASGWRLINSVFLDTQYQKWYYRFLRKIIAKKKEIIAQFGSSAYDYVFKTYSELLADIENKQLGGAVFYVVL